jgi:hypothetical protein
MTWPQLKKNLKRYKLSKLVLRQDMMGKWLRRTPCKRKQTRPKRRWSKQTLINSLGDNKDRWVKNAAEFKSLKQRLAGDVAKACAFVSYCGPFNSEFRQKLLEEYFHTDLVQKEIPVSEDLQLTQFLVD